MLKDNDKEKSWKDRNMGQYFDDLYVGKFYDRIFGTTYELHLINMTDITLSVRNILKLAEIAKTDYPGIDPNEIIVDGIVGTSGTWTREVYSISFIMDEAPKNDYKPLSDLFPDGYRFFT